MSREEVTIEELEASRREIAKIISETDENIWEYKFLLLTLASIDEQIETCKKAVQKLEKRKTSDFT